MAKTVGTIRRSVSSVDAIVAELVTGVEFRKGQNVEGLATLAQRANVAAKDALSVCTELWAVGLLSVADDKAGWTVLFIPADAVGGAS